MNHKTMNTIVYKSSFGQTDEIPLGQDYQVDRQEGDVVIARDVAHDVPIKVAIQVTADGQWHWWYSEPHPGRGNPYWHFSNMPTEGITGELRLPECTQAQRETLRKIETSEISVFGLTGSFGMPVVAWAFGEEEARETLAYHN